MTGFALLMLALCLAMALGRIFGDYLADQIERDEAAR